MIVVTLCGLPACSKENNVTVNKTDDEGFADCTAKPPQLDLIDDFECGPPGALPTWDERDGGWYTQSDDQEENTFVDANDPAFDFADVRCRVGRDSDWAACANGKTAQCDVSTDCWGAALGVSFRKDGVAYDAAARGYTGVSFDLRSISAQAPLPILLSIADDNTIPAGGKCATCFDYFSKSIESSGTWQTITIKFADLAQQGFGDPEPALDATHLQYIDWRFPPGQSVAVAIDNLMFVK